jgi:hypothetical protein
VNSIALKRRFSIRLDIDKIPALREQGAVFFADLTAMTADFLFYPFADCRQKNLLKSASNPRKSASKK